MEALALMKTSGKKGDEGMNPAYRKSRFLATGLIIFSCVTCLVLLPDLSRAQMCQVDDEDLSGVTAQAGINYVIGGSQLRVTRDSYSFSDTDHTPHNWMEFNNFTIDDGEGGYFSMDTPFSYDEWTYNTIDVATTEEGDSRIFMNLSTWVEPRTITVGNFVFCDQDLGSIQLSNMRKGTSDSLIIGSRGGGQCGIDLEYQTELTLDSLEYAFNTQPSSSSLSLTGIHLAGNAVGSPEDPTSWMFLGKFKIGDFADNRPMTIDVGTYDDGLTASTSVFYNIPMSGTIRVENVDFGGKQLGPCAIDGITVHHLGIQIPGN